MKRPFSAIASTSGRTGQRTQRPGPMTRASDGDREQTAGCLRRAASEGRLSLDELEQRLEATFTARTYGELDWLACDLPRGREQHPSRRLQGRLQRRRKIALAAALLVVLILIAGAAAVGYGRSSAAAAYQLAAPRTGQLQPP